MSSPPSQRQRHHSPNEANPAQAAAALAAAQAMRHASSHAVVRICGTSPSECGYCKGARAKTPAEAASSSQAYSLLGDFMTPETYEGYLYRGWRRSGTYLYKPNNWSSCCPALTIRLPVGQFVPTKSQKKVVKKMDHILERQPQQEGKRGQKRKHPSQSTEEVMIEQGNVLQQLQQLTLPILRSLLQGYAEQNSIPSLASLKLEPSFRIRPPTGKKKKTNSELSAAKVHVCTTICASLAGQSKGAINKDQLSEQLTQHLLAAYAGKPNPLPQNNNIPLKSSSPSSPPPPATWTITDVSRHAKSGQVFCDLQVHDALQNGSRSQILNDDASMKDVSEATPDKLLQWLQDNGPTMAQFTRQPKNPNNLQQMQPPYSFAMETVPAHQSALDPEVHKLYFLYQNKVHQDSDPFTCDLNNPMNNSSSNMNVAADDANSMEDDEWSTPATSDGNDLWPKSDPNSGKLSPPPPPASNPYDRNPPGFVDTAKRMLQREYSHLHTDRLKQIVKSFGSFYQFLVESPFTIPTNGYRGASTTVTATPSESTLPIHHLPPGTYHQQYRVAGMLIAVGVVDVLPRGLSSVYLFYHPKFARDLVPLGKYAILQEIEFARALRLPYYYLGYYIESCTKMRYKAEYRPSELLCPTTYRWVPATLAQRILPLLSPVQHCCTLYYEDVQKLEGDLQVAGKKVANEKKSSADAATTIPHAGDDDVSMDDLADTAADTSAPASLQQSAPTNSVAAAPAPTKTKSILKKPNPSPFPPNPYVEQVKMDVGVGVPVTLSMLHERGRETVRPLLEEFVKEAGPQLCQKCLVKFN